MIEAQKYLNEAVSAFRNVWGKPDYKSEFRILQRFRPTEIRLKLAEALAFGGQQADAYGIISEFTFKPIIPFAGATDSSDYAWHHTKGFVLATMGMYKEAADTLERFKIVSPTDYMQVDEALYFLRCIRKTCRVTRQKYIEAELVASMLENSRPVSRIICSAHLSPDQCSERKIFRRNKFYNKNFEEA